mgnify:CR=1 FL=1
MLSAGRVAPGNNGQTDVGRGSLESLPVGTNMAPRGRVESVKGALSMIPNDASPAGLHRRVPGRGAALNGLAR